MFISHVEKVNLQEDVAELKATVKALRITVDAMQAEIQMLKLGRPVTITAGTGLSSQKSVITLSTPKRRGRPVGSKNKPKKVTLSASEVKFANQNNIKLSDYARAKATPRKKK